MSAEITKPSEVSDCGLSPEQKAGLNLPTRLCLILTANPHLQEKLYEGSELNEMFAQELGFDISDKKSKETHQLRQAVHDVQHPDSLIKFEVSELEEQVPIIRNNKPTTRTDITRLMQATVTNIGLEKLAQEIEKVSHGT